MQIRILLILACLSLPAVRALGGEPWLLAFPDIAYDDDRVTFSNDQWTAFYSLEQQGMFTVPRDSVHLPPFRRRTNTVLVDLTFYTCYEDEIRSVVFPYAPDVARLPKLTASLAAPLLEAWEEAEEKVSEIEEDMGPVCANGSMVWFGLTAHGPGKHYAGGIGWFNTSSRSFGRIYSPSLDKMSPEWIDVVRDTVVVMYRDANAARRLVSYAIDSAELHEMDWHAADIPGDSILSIDRWRNFLLLATDQAVAIWAPNHLANVWTTSAWAAKQPVRLQMLKFRDGKPIENSAQDFLPMHQNRPSEVWAQVGDWVELVAHAGIEGYIDDETWQNGGSKWSGQDWGCDKPCFARVRVPTRGTFIDGDLYNTPLTFIDFSDEGVKIGFTAGWTRLEYLTPALIPYP